MRGKSVGLLAMLVCVASAARAQDAAQAVSPQPAASPAQACIDDHVEAQRARMAGGLIAARQKLVACAQSTCPALISNDCTTWLGEVDASLPSIVLAVVDAEGRDLAGVRVSANGTRIAERIDGQAIALDPGGYELVFEAPGYTRFTTKLTVRQAEKNRIVRAQLAKIATAEGGIPVLSYVLGGVAVAGFATFAYFGLTGSDEYDALEERCGRNCTDEQVEDGKLAYIVADVGLGVGIAAAAGAVLAYALSRPSEQAEPAKTRVGVAPVQGGAHVQWSGRF